MQNRPWLKVIISIFIIFGILISYTGYSIWTYGNQEEIIKTDAAIVLGAAAWGDKPSPVLRERLNHAIKLYQDGYVNKLIFTGGKGEGAIYAESEVSRDYAIKKNVKSTDIYIETKSQITEENIYYAKLIAKKHNLKTLTLVSDPLHMKRAMLMARNLDMKVYNSPTETTVYKTLQSKIPFFLRELFFYVGYIVTIPFR